MAVNEQGMKVAHVLNRFEPGGVEKWLVDLVRANVATGTPMQLDFILHSNQPGFFDADVEDCGGNLIRIELNRANPIAYAWRLFRALRTSRYDVVHTHVHHFSGWVALVAFLAGVPVRVAHSHADSSKNSGEGSVLRRLYRTLCSWLIQVFSTRQIAVSEPAALDLFRHPDKAVIMTCGLMFASPRSKADGTALTPEERRFRLLHVGRFTDEKNHEFLVELCCALRDRELDFILYLVGDGPLKTVFEERFARLGLQQHVCFLGKRKDVHEIMASAFEAFVFPSRSEGLGLAVIEAQFFGLKTLASNAVPSAVEVSDYIEFLPIEQGSIATWADAVEAAKQPHESQRQRCVERVLASELNIYNNLNGLIELYGGLAASEPSPEN